MTAEEYNRRVRQACQLLEGKSRQLLRDMTAEMEAEAEALRFEQAALLRDRINAISALAKKQTVIAGLCADTDIWGVYKGAGKCCYAVLHMEEGNLAGRETELFTAPIEETEEEMLAALTAQYYLPRAILPHEILLPTETEGYCESLSEALTKRAGRRVWVHVPQRGEKADLRAMAQRNAAEEAERPPPPRSGWPTPWSCWESCWTCPRRLGGWSPSTSPTPGKATSWHPWWCTAAPGP